MKILRNILWILFPIALIVFYICVQARIMPSFFAINLSLALILCLPITACLVQTLMNKDKNPSSNQFLLKLVVIIYLYIMVFFLFASVPYAQ